MAKFIGSDCTKGALEWQFRRYKAGAKLQAEAVKAGRDPKDVNIDVNPQGKLDGATGSSGRGCNCTLLFSFVSTQRQHGTAFFLKRHGFN
jgi:hypothetical protein